jgi:hypothetical protein
VFHPAENALDDVMAAVGDAVERVEVPPNYLHGLSQNDGGYDHRFGRFNNISREA